MSVYLNSVVPPYLNVHLLHHPGPHHCLVVRAGSVGWQKCRTIGIHRVSGWCGRCRALRGCADCVHVTSDDDIILAVLLLLLHLLLLYLGQH